MVSLRDVSKKVGLSTATVSRALNGFDDVHPKTRARVEEAARELGYVANRAAKLLVSGKSNIICLIADLELVRKTRDAGSPDFLELISRLSCELAERGFDLVFSVKSPNETAVAKYQDMIKRGIVDAFIVGAPMQDDPRIAFLKEVDFPFVVHGLPPVGADLPFVSVDNAQIVRDPLLALLDLGHKHIAFVQGPPDTTHAVQRHDTYREVLNEAGLAADEHMIIMDGDNPSKLKAQLLGLFSGRLGPKPTAIMCGSVALAQDCANILVELGLKVPDDVSLVANDDGGDPVRLDTSIPELCRTYFDWSDTSGPLAEVAINVSQKGMKPGPDQCRNLACEMIFGKSIGRPSPGLGGEA
ncbi:LacI family DNA-binding transcriptional regulator [Cognatiyoonia sp. IB215182]|uniref:LacI family DNA-binding transcriptional regulator n=1 Tax=Cognatiyoonia sp. IB215182 TaxID=3097353 RepID=UPI002A0C0160|nr:LacI family DNA-binding transcriptional regulator [Cognatiyoonia sp. IB215182]MDX8352977.1 LacI family DNA-binding transcriptional regulator [Cognatiyoonia sp. IB215182]